MKKILKITVIVVVGLMASLLLASQLTKNKTGMLAYTIDLLNPFVTMEEVYGKVPAEPVSNWQDAANGGQDYGYHVKTYSKSGKNRTVRVATFGSKISQDVKFLKIKTKGQSVRSYDYIDEAALPQKVLKAMEENK